MDVNKSMNLFPALIWSLEYSSSWFTVFLEELSSSLAMKLYHIDPSCSVEVQIATHTSIPIHEPHSYLSRPALKSHPSLSPSTDQPSRSTLPQRNHHHYQNKQRDANAPNSNRILWISQLVKSFSVYIVWTIWLNAYHCLLYGGARVGSWHSIVFGVVRAGFWVVRAFAGHNDFAFVVERRGDEMRWDAWDGMGWDGVVFRWQAT